MQIRLHTRNLVGIRCTDTHAAARAAQLSRHTCGVSIERARRACEAYQVLHIRTYQYVVYTCTGITKTIERNVQSRLWGTYTSKYNENFVQITATYYRSHRCSQFYSGDRNAGTTCTRTLYSYSVLVHSYSTIIMAVRVLVRCFAHCSYVTQLLLLFRVHRYNLSSFWYWNSTAFVDLPANHTSRSETEY